MTAGIKTILYPVTDLARAKARFQRLLGTEPHTDSPYYVGFSAGGQEIGLVPGGQQPGLAGYFDVADIQAEFKALLADGAEEVAGIKDVGGGRLVATVKDADGNLIGLLQDTK